MYIVQAFKRPELWSINHLKTLIFSLFLIDHFYLIVDFRSKIHNYEIMHP